MRTVALRLPDDLRRLVELAPMRIDHKFLDKLLGVKESDSKSISVKIDVPYGLATFQSLLDKRRRKRFESLSAALSTEDDLGKVVRAHIHIEHELQEVIFLAAPNPDHIKRFDNM